MKTQTKVIIIFGIFVFSVIAYTTWSKMEFGTKELGTESKTMKLLPSGEEIKTFYTQNSSSVIINFTFLEDGTEIIAGITVQNITIDGTICTKNGVATYDSSNGWWGQNCTTPNKIDGTYDLQVYANTSTSGFLTGTQTGAIIYQTDTCTYSGSGIWMIDCSDNCVITTDTELAGNVLIFSGAGTVNIDAKLSGMDYMWKDRRCKIIKSRKVWIW